MYKIILRKQKTNLLAIQTVLYRPVSKHYQQSYVYNTMHRIYLQDCRTDSI